MVVFESNAGCSPNGLILNIHNGLPYLFNGQSLSENASVDEIFNDVLRAAGWGGIIALLAVILMICNCVSCCFVCGFCCGRDKKPTPIKIGVGVATFVLVVISIIFVLAEFGIEVSIHKTITNSAENVRPFVATYEDNNTIEVIVNTIEKQRHSAILSCLGILLFKLLVPMVWIFLAPVCGSPAGPALIFVDLVITGVITFIMSIGMASVFVVLVIYSDVCVHLYSINPQLQLCTDPAMSVVASAMDGFCNKTVTYGFTLFILGMLLVLLLLLVMLFGAIFATSLTGRRTVEISVSANEVYDPSVLSTEHAYGGARIYYKSEDEAPLMAPVADV